MEKPESFEIAEYNDVREPYEKYQVLRQIIEDHRHDVPVTTCSYKVDFVGDQMKVYYMSYEPMLPHRMKEVEKQSNDAHKEILRHLKKEYRSRTKNAVGLTEQKEKADYTVNKVSLNERYMFVSWRFYKLD